MLAGVSESPLLAGYKHSWTSLFVLEQHGAHRSAAPVSRFVKTLAPIFRIVIIMSLTLTLVVNYCDDLNPLDNLRARLHGVRPISMSEIYGCGFSHECIYAGPGKRDLGGLECMPRSSARYVFVWEP